MALGQMLEAASGRRQGLPVRLLLAALLAVYVLALVVGYTLRGPGPLFDGITLLLAVGFGGLLLALLWTARRAIFPLAAVLIFTCLIFVLPRLLQYLWTPDLVEFPFGTGTDSASVNLALVALLAGTAAVGAGFAAAATVLRRAGWAQPRVAPEPNMYSTSTILLVFAIMLAIEVYISVVMGVGVFGKYRADTGNTLIQLLKVMFGIDMAFFMALIALSPPGRAPRKYAWAAVLVVVYIFYLTYTGSRVGGLRVLTMLMMYLLAARGNFRVRLGDLTVVVLPLALVSVLAFPLATYTRNVLVVERFLKLGGERPASIRGVDQRVRAAEIVGRKDLELYERPLRFAAVVLNRLGAIDYLVLVVTEPGDPAEKARYLSLGYAAKSIINTFMPGALFPEEELSTSRAHSIVYRGIKGITHLSAYNSEYWTLWGLGYLLFGWAGGVVALAAAGALFQAVYLGIMRFAGGYRVYLGAWFLFMTSLYYLSMGVDHSVTVSVITLLQCVTTLAGFHAAETVTRSVGRPVPASS